MIKLLLFVGATWIVLMLLKQRKISHTTTTNTPPENMVNCAVCHIHLPQSEAIASQGQYYCCEAHFMQRKK